MGDGAIMRGCDDVMGPRGNLAALGYAPDMRSDHAITFCREAGLDGVQRCMDWAKRLLATGTLEGWGDRTKDIVKADQPIARLCALAAMVELPHYIPQLDVAQLGAIGNEHGWRVFTEAAAGGTEFRMDLDKLKQRDHKQLEILMLYLVSFHARGFFCPMGKMAFKKDPEALSCAELFEDACRYWRSVVYLYTVPRDVGKHLVAQHRMDMFQPMTRPGAPIIKMNVRSIAAIHSEWAKCTHLDYGNDDFNDTAWPMKFTDAEVDEVFKAAFLARIPEQPKRPKSARKTSGNRDQEESSGGSADKPSTASADTSHDEEEQQAPPPEEENICQSCGATGASMRCGWCK